MSYYGTIWTDEEILSYANFCRGHGYDFFIYAPKLDLNLREHWDQPLTSQYIARFQTISSYYRSKDIQFGMAISPYNTAKLSHAQEQAFIQKIRQLNSINLDILGVFFDDVSKDLVREMGDSLALAQKSISEIALNTTTATTLFTVPTYYSHDAILTRVLGPMPLNYLKDFGLLDQRFNVF